MQKTRHLIEGPCPVKIYTDHKSAEDIMNMTSLKSNSAVRQNLHLVRASQFVSQFPNVKIVYRRSKDNINADSLSRLIQLRSEHHPDNDVDGVYGFTVTVVGFSMSTLRKLEEGYTNDRHLSFIYNNLKLKVNWKNKVLDNNIPDTDVLSQNLLRSCT
jgi:hypothetical protein